MSLLIQSSAIRFGDSGRAVIWAARGSAGLDGRSIRKGETASLWASLGVALVLLSPGLSA
jgi:hypothetical protein